MFIVVQGQDLVEELRDSDIVRFQILCHSDAVLTVFQEFSDCDIVRFEEFGDGGVKEFGHRDIILFQELGKCIDWTADVLK